MSNHIRHNFKVKDIIDRLTDSCECLATLCSSPSGHCENEPAMFEVTGAKGLREQTGVRGEFVVQNCQGELRFLPGQVAQSLAVSNS